MFEGWKDIFSLQDEVEVTLKVDQSGKPSDQDLQVACAILLVEMARADKSIAAREGETVVALMSEQFGIDPKDMPKLIEIAMAARKAQVKIDSFVRCINERMIAEQKVRLLAMLWKVMIADGQIAKHEERLATQMKCRLQLTDDQADDARAMAEQGKV